MTAWGSRLTVGVWACGMLVIGGCSLQPADTLDQAPELQRFDSAEDFKSFLTRQLVEGRNFGIGGVLEGDVALGQPVPQTAPGADADTVASDGFSSTNIQEAGVRESDVVQTDGNYLYMVDQEQLRIVRAVPADQLQTAARLDVGPAQELYLSGDTVVVVGTAYRYEAQPLPTIDVGGDAAIAIEPFFFSTPLTSIAVVSVQDPQEPVLLARYELEGWLVSSRLIDSMLHLVVGASLQVAPLAEDTREDTPVEAIIPDVTVITPEGERTEELLGVGDIYYEAQPQSSQVTVVASLDITKPADSLHTVGALTRADTVYVSRNALYIANVIYPVFIAPLLGAPDRAVGDSSESTALYKFDLGAEGARLVGSGIMPGRLLDRYSLSEHDGFLRAATTVGQIWFDGQGAVTNNVYVLELQDGELSIVGRIEGLAPGEQIFSARFVGDRGFLVTFVKIDPLFTLDLKDPSNPRVVGELKVPGYSDYIHPLGDQHLLTIGKDAVDAGDGGDFAWYQGVQLSLFDVGEFADPRRLDVEVVGDRGTESEALYNPHAFNFFAPLELLAVPMLIAEKAPGQEDPAISGQPVFQGLCLYRVSVEEGIEPVGHLSTLRDGGSSYFYGGWTRGVFIDGHIYAVTPERIMTLPVSDLSAAPHTLELMESR